MIKTINQYYKLIIIGAILLSFIIHLSIFNLDLVGKHVWRQTQTQTVINNFAEEDFNILNPRVNYDAHTDRVFRMEFPIMQWLFAVFYKTLGDHIIISRLFTFVIGIFTLIGFYTLCKKLFNNRVHGTIAFWCFSFSPLFYYYTVNPLPDNFALCCGIWCLVYFFSFYKSGRSKDIVISSILLLLASLSKLPFILFGATAVAYFAKHYSSNPSQALKPAISYAIFLSPAIAWYVFAIQGWHGNGIVNGVFGSEPFSISEFIHILSGTLISTLPESILNYGSILFFIYGVYLIIKEKLYRKKFFSPIMWVLALVMCYYLYEINMIGLVHDYYLFPFMPFIFLPVVYGAYKMLSSRKSIVRTIALTLLLILPLTAYLREGGSWDTEEPGFNPVYYHHKTELRDLIEDDAYVIVGNDISNFILLYYLDSKGWVFRHDKLSPYDLKYFISQGAGYIFTDSRVDEQEEIKPFLKEKIFEKEGLRVYTLQKPDQK